MHTNKVVRLSFLLSYVQPILIFLLHSLLSHIFFKLLQAGSTVLFVRNILLFHTTFISSYVTSSFDFLVSSCMTLVKVKLKDVLFDTCCT